MTAYDGDCSITRITSPAGVDCLRVDRADKFIRIAPELLDEVRSAGHPYAQFVADELRIVGINRTVTYRIGEKVTDQFGAAWYEATREDPS